MELAARTIWNPSAYRALRALVREERPQIVHFHNTFPLMSPAAYYAARAEGAGVVQTLHNFRLTCANALLYRDGTVCEDCLTKFSPWPSIARKCYRDSRAASAALTAMLAAHRALGTWRYAIDVYVALTEFGRRKFVAAGLPAERIVVKPNFVEPDPGPGPGGGGYGVFVGRLSMEKGVETLLDAWRHLDGEVPLRVVGDGPMAARVKDAVARDPAIQWMGSLPLDAVYQVIGAAEFVVLPSKCFENFPRVIAEAFARGTPVIASRMGAMEQIVDEGRTGVLFAPGDAIDLALKTRQLHSDYSALAKMRRAARAEFERCFHSAANHEALMAVYERCLPMGARTEPCH